MRRARRDRVFRHCPVCKQTLGAAVYSWIADHWDSVGRDVCPMSGKPYSLAGYGRGSEKIAVELPADDAAATPVRFDRIERLLSV